MPTVNITQEALTRLRQATWDKHGTLRGTLQAEATAAIHFYLDAKGLQLRPEAD